MGLDQYAFAVRPEREATDHDFGPVAKAAYGYYSDEYVSEDGNPLGFTGDLSRYIFPKPNEDGTRGEMSYRDLDKGEAQVSDARGTAIVLLQQWRKHPDLQRWMENLAIEKGWVCPEGSWGWCAPIRVTSADLDALEAAVTSDSLPVNEGGFFFGQSYPEDKELDLEFIARARRAIAGDMEIYYDSSW